MSIPNLAEPIPEALPMCARQGTAPALVGGLAVVAHHVVRATDARVVLASEAGVPLQPPLAKAGSVDPFAEKLTLMEVVHLLCPAWPVRQSTMRGKHWRI